MKSVVELRAPTSGVASGEALDFVIDLHSQFRASRTSLLEARRGRQVPPSTSPVPEFTVAPVPADITDRRVEITGPVDPKMMINALNSGAKVFMADFEDATTPTWENLTNGQANLVDAYRGTLRLETSDKVYEIHDDPARLFVRPRGWHLPEKHVLFEGQPVSASLFDFGLYMFHGGRAALEAGTAPYLYLPKLESHLEARLWNDAFVYAQEKLGISPGTIKATVLIETLPAAFEMDQILYELREHSAGLNAGRWDYIFSTIKVMRDRPGFMLPDRSQITMTVPFMKAYTELLVATCHRRGAHAIGGMAAFIPNRRDPAVTDAALTKVEADKTREAGQGFDGTWVAHPDLVSVARACFDEVLGDHPDQRERLRQDVNVGAEELLDFTIPDGQITEAGVRTNLRAGIYYLASWLAGTGAAAIDNLMEDVATAEISRCQIWQWVHRGARLEDGRPVDRTLVRRLAEEEKASIPLDTTTAWKVFEEVALADDFVEFLTLPAYELID